MSQALLLRVIALEAFVAGLVARLAVIEEVGATNLPALNNPASEMRAPYGIVHGGFGRWRVFDRFGEPQTGYLRKEEAERLAAEFTANVVQQAARSVA